MLGATSSQRGEYHVRDRLHPPVQHDSVRVPRAVHDQGLISHIVNMFNQDAGPTFVSWVLFVT